MTVITSPPILSSQQIEKIAMWDLHQAATEAQRQTLGLRCFGLGDDEDTAMVSLAGKLPDPAIVMNMTFDLSCGLSREGQHEELTRRIDTAVASYQEQGVGRYFLQFVDSDNSPEVNQLFTERGLKPARGWQEFERDDAAFNEPLPALAANCEVKLIDATHGGDFGRIACAGFDFVVPGQDPEIAAATEAWLGQLLGRPNWHVFMGFVDGQAASVGVLFMHQNHGWLSFGSTWPDFRGRGLQSAVLRARVEHGIKLGCTKFHTCTGVAVPGDPQHSYNNILKNGFEPTHVMANYQPK